MTVEKLAIWVHPLWSSRDLGQKVVDAWEKNINSFANDESQALILVGCIRDVNYNQEWFERVIPIIHELPELFNERYIRMVSNFVDANNQNHISQISKQFGLANIRYYKAGFPIDYLFNEIRVDGLIRNGDYCVAHQMRKIRTLTKSVKYWKDMD